MDIQVSSLIQLARTLDLELMLIPKKLISTVNAIQMGDELKGESFSTYRLDDDNNEGKDV